MCRMPPELLLELTIKIQKFGCDCKLCKTLAKPAVLLQYRRAFVTKKACQLDFLLGKSI